jgi:hypothetical protein
VHLRTAPWDVAQPVDSRRSADGTERDQEGRTMNKPVAIIIALLGWAGVILVQNFSSLVPHASPREVEPFKIPVLIFALVATALVIKVFAAKPKP